MCKVIIHFSEFPTNPGPYVRYKSRRPPSSTPTFPKVTGYMIFSQFLLINLHLLCRRSTGIMPAITNTAGADTVRYADAIRKIVVLCDDKEWLSPAESIE